MRMPEHSHRGEQRRAGVRGRRDRQPRVALVADVADLADLVIVVELEAGRRLGQRRPRVWLIMSASATAFAPAMFAASLSSKQHGEGGVDIGDRAGGDDVGQRFRSRGDR